MIKLHLLLLFFALARKCSSNVCDLCNCRTEEIENELMTHVNCTVMPKFARLVDLNGKNTSGIYLSMDDMNLTSIQRYIIFEGFDVKKFSLNRNKIKFMPPRVLNKFVKLESLSVAENEIEIITKDSFEGLPNLKYLNISYNALNTFDIEYIKALNKLEVLDLSGNNLFTIQVTSYEQYLTLNYINLYGNKLSLFPEKAFKLCRSLKYINISNNQLKSIPEGAFEWQLIAENIDLSKNHIADIHRNTFPRQNSILVLNLKNNLISNTEFMKDMKNLTELDISFNSLTSLNTTTWGNSLKKLLIGNNGLTSLEGISGLSKLEKLDASWNQCTGLPKNLSESLRELLLDETAISNLPSRFPVHGGNLTYLSLSGLPRLKTLPKDVFSGVFNTGNETCKKLIISRTGLESIDKSALRDLNICELDLSWNKLKTLPEDTFNWDYIQKINLQGNPWHCECSMQWLLDKVVSNMYKSHQELLENLRCASPEALVGTRLVHWYNKSEPMLCKPDILEGNVIRVTSSPAMIIIDIVLGVLAIILVVTGFYLQRRAIREKRTRKNRRF